MKPERISRKIKTILNRESAVRISVFVAITASIALMTGGLYTRSTMYITDNGITKEVKTNETDIYGILKEEGYALSENDLINIRTNEDGIANVTITRAFPVSVTADGKTTLVEIAGGDVDYALRKAGVKLGKNDEINYSTDMDVFSGMKISITRITTKTTVTTEAIPFATQYEDTDEEEQGYEEVIQEGHDGTRKITVTETYADGKLIDTDTKKTVAKKPVNEIVKRGTAEPVEFAAPASLGLDGGIPSNYLRVVSGKATAYTAPAGSLTASGRVAKVGHVAVNPNVIPYGSELYIVAQDGSRAYGYCVAADTGGAMMDGRAVVDLFMDTYEDCCDWGAVYVDIYVLSEGNG